MTLPDGFQVDTIWIDAKDQLWITYHWHQGDRVRGRCIKPAIIRDPTPPVDLGRLDMG